MSHPSPRFAAIDSGVAREVMRATVAGARMRTPSSVPPASSMRAKRDRSRAVEKRPACPATPPMRREVGSWTTPLRGTAEGRLHGQASIVSQRSVGAILVRWSAEGRNPVSRIPSGWNTTSRV
ncbi:MAG: hypothetical protein R2712_17555 [Vicinamibacterales bacterium]